jgi:4a-hydroxytetrahydrobiopterin dehydratase
MNWSIIANRFRTVIHFANQTELALFLVEVAQLADQMDHHPDLTIRHCSELSISVYSHDQQKITKRDHRLVEKISELYDDWKKIKKKK